MPFKTWPAIGAQALNLLISREITDKPLLALFGRTSAQTPKFKIRKTNLELKLTFKLNLGARMPKRSEFLVGSSH